MSATLRTFMYHDIRNPEDTPFPNRYKLRSFLTEKQFLAQLKYISERYVIISSLDILKIDLKDFKSDLVVLTFDDGLKDHYQVYKWLKQYKFPATFFVPSKPILEHSIIKSHMIQFIIAACDEKELTKELLENHEGEHYQKMIWDKYSKSKWKNNWWTPEMTFLTNYMRDTTICSERQIEFLFLSYVHPSIEEFSKDLYLSKLELEEMSYNQYINIGGHGDTSINLLDTSYPDKEVDKCAKFISKYSDTFTFSYPNGGFNDDIKDILDYNKCQLAFTVVPKTLTDLDDIDYLEMPRYDGPQKLPLN